MVSCRLLFSHFHGTNHIWTIRIWMVLRLLHFLWIKLFALCQDIDLLKAFRGCLAILTIGTHYSTIRLFSFGHLYFNYEPEKYPKHAEQKFASQNGFSPFLFM